MFAPLRSATRSLLRWRGGALVAALTLAVGIGAATGLAALVRLVLADLPGVPALDRVGRVYAASPSLGVERGNVALGEFDSALSKAASFQAIGGYADEDALVGRGATARPVIAGYASPGFFAVMGVPPLAGRVFTPGDLAGTPVVVVSDALWRRDFADARLGSATLLVDGVERTVIGVMPPEFRYPFVGVSADLWVPLTRATMEMPSIVAVYGRLRDGVEWPAAQAELTGLSRAQRQWRWQAIPLAADIRTRAVAAYALTLGPAALVLLIACVNVACLLMARGIARERELTVRRALGATRGAIFGLLFLESAALATVSGTIGGALAMVTLRVLSSVVAPLQPSMASALSADIRLLPVALAASAMACLLFGVVPALRLSRRDIVRSLNGLPARHRIDVGGYGARDAVAFAEIAAAVGFVVWTALIYTLFAELNRVRLSFPADRVIAMRVPAGTVQDVATRIAAIPGIASTAISAEMLGGGARERAETGAQTVVLARIPVGRSFLDTLGVAMLRGRGFTADEMTGAGVAIVSETGARHLAADGNVIGLRLRTAVHGEIVIIGVCRDPVEMGAVSRIDSYAVDTYVPYEPPAASREAIVLARTTGDAHAALHAVVDAAIVPPGVRPPRPIVLSDDFAQRNGSQGSMLAARCLAAFALLTLLLAASGVFAVISQSVAQRTREFGIRLAIGATPGRVLRMVLVREGQLIGAAVVTGVIFTALATRVLFAELVDLNASVPSNWVIALLLSGGIAAAAVLVAAYRIVRLEPAAVLRRT